MSYTVPSISLSTSTAGSPQLYLQFARADTSIPLTLSIGSLNDATGWPYDWAYAFSASGYTHPGADLTKYRMVYSGILAGSWVSLPTPIPAGTYWITGLDLTSLTWDSDSGAKSASVAAGTFTDSLTDVDVDAESDSESDLPLHHLVAAGADGREITKIRYRLNQSNAAAGAWLGTPTGEAIIRRFAT